MTASGFRPTFRPEADRAGDPAEPPAGTDGRVNACGEPQPEGREGPQARSGVEAAGRLRSSKVTLEGRHGSACQTMPAQSLSCPILPYPALASPSQP